MGTAERRKEIMKILCRRKHETVKNLAFEFGVSERTIRRDIEILSLTEPIYTQTGRYSGGVYVVEDYLMYQIHMTEKESEIFITCRISARKYPKWGICTGNSEGDY